MLAAQFTKVEDESAFKAEAEAITKAMETMSSDFTQEKHLSFMTEPIITAGKYHYKKPNKIRWEYTSPFSYILIINNDKLFIDDEGNQNKIDLGNNQLFNQINETISNALTGKVLDYSEQFSHSLEESETDFKINLFPKEKAFEEYIEQIEVFFDKESMIVSQVILKEASEDFTKIIFENKQLNKPIEDSVFEMK